MKHLLEFILVHLVTQPEAVEVIEEEGYNGPVFHLRVHPDDVGRVIGKQGKIIKAIRKVAQIRAIKDGRWVQVVLDSESEEHQEQFAPTETDMSPTSEG
jgi:predicted RNA-binding protein YlqC (UPF0109 family)